MKIQKIIRIGSSVGVVIPKPLMVKLGLKVGDEVELTSVENGIAITPVKPRPKIAPEILEWVEQNQEKVKDLMETLRQAQGKEKGSTAEAGTL